MTNEINLSSNNDDLQNIQADAPTMWGWYFGIRFASIYRIPIFAMLSYTAIWLAISEIRNVIFFFKNTAISWGSVFVVVFGGFIWTMLFFMPVILCFSSINWLYKINVEKQKITQKFFYSLGIILSVIIGSQVIAILGYIIIGFGTHYFKK